jgi:WD40 repeat protein
LSSGYEFEILIWNLSKTEPVEKLSGHESLIVSLCCPSETFNAVSCDIKGVIKIWDLRDFNCSETIYIAGALQVMGIVPISKHRRLLAYCILISYILARKFHVYEYENPFSPEYSSDSAITTLRFSNVKLEIFVGGCIVVECKGRSIHKDMECEEWEAREVVYRGL